MLNLEELENKLDLVLANETNESLTKWLEISRLRNCLNNLGEGTFEYLSTNKHNYSFKEKSNSIEVPPTAFLLEDIYQYKIAS